MAQRNTADDASGAAKKDRQAAQRLRDEIDEETRNRTVRAQRQDPNRDAARGDWDRSSRHHDEGVARDAPEPDEQARPADQYPGEGE